jgi:uncharacterized protein
MNVVIDTNIFVSAVMSADGASGQIVRMCLSGAHSHLMGNTLCSEFEPEAVEFLGSII